MITIYYLSYCPHSMKALETLNKLNIKYKSINSDEIKEKVIEINTKKTKNYIYFPQIFWGRQFIGGNKELQDILNKLKNKQIPEQSEEWTKKKWLKFLTYISK